MCIPCSIINSWIVVEAASIIWISKSVVAIVPPWVTVPYEWSPANPWVIVEGIVAIRIEWIVVPAPVVRWIIIAERESIERRRPVPAKVVVVYHTCG